MTLAVIFVLAAVAVIIFADPVVGARRLRRKRHNAQRGRTHA
jgi:hypothetical protein